MDNFDRQVRKSLQNKENLNEFRHSIYQNEYLRSPKAWDSYNGQEKSIEWSKKAQFKTSKLDAEHKKKPTRE